MSLYVCLCADSGVHEYSCAYVPPENMHVCIISTVLHACGIQRLTTSIFF